MKRKYFWGRIGLLVLLVVILNFAQNGNASVTQNDINKINETSQSVQDGLEKGLERIGELFKYVSPSVSTQTEENNSLTLEKVSLVRVVDGDTIIVSTEDGEELRVRLIGIDTPESVNPDESKNTSYGKKASDYTKDILSNYSTLYLEYDEEKQDTYSRTLAYVWFTDQVDPSDVDNITENMLNAELLVDGYAYNKVYEPNDKYAGVFEQLRIQAESEGTGLWQYEGFGQLWVD